MLFALPLYQPLNIHLYIKNTDNIEDIKHYVKCLDSEVKQQLPDSHVTLKELDDTLINAKKKIFDRYLKSLDK